MDKKEDHENEVDESEVRPINKKVNLETGELELFESDVALRVFARNLTPRPRKIEFTCKLDTSNPNCAE